MNDSGQKRWDGKDPTGRKPRGRRGLALLASAGLAAAAISAVPASASLTGEGVRAGSNITVFHNIDFVAVFGYGPVGSDVTVEVIRDGATIGTATGPAIDAEGLPGLEVNHGPEGAAVAGDCWEGNTPDILPGDVIHVTTSDGAVDEVTVDNIGFTGGPREARSGDVLVPFNAFRANGNPIPASFIDSAEFRAASNNSVRFEGTRVVVQRRAGGGPGRYQMRFRSPFRPSRNDDENPLNQRQLRRALLGDGHAVGFGHVDPLPLESMLVDGLEDTPGPAPGCEAAPSASWGVNNVAPNDLNRRNLDRGLTVNGIATGATAVSLSLRDGTGPAVTRNATLTGNRWTASFTRAQLRSLNGIVRVSGRYRFDGRLISGNTMTLRKDLVRPSEPRASLRAGTYRRTKRVALSGGRQVAQIRYTLGGGRQARPTVARGTVYNGRIRISSTQVLKAVAVDRAGNVSTVKRLRYRIAR